MLPRRMNTGRGGRLDLETELSRPLTLVLVFFVMVLVPLGSYFYLHKYCPTLAPALPPPCHLTAPDQSMTHTQAALSRF
jgi:hypothetical protein